MSISYLPNAVYSAPFTTLLLFFPQLVIVAYYNDSDDPSFYYSAEEFQDVYQFPNKPPVVDLFTAGLAIPLGNTGAEPSDKLACDTLTLVPLQVPHVGLQTSTPTGGMIPEITADADKTKMLQKKRSR